jgi:hypothetical protein
LLQAERRISVIEPPIDTMRLVSAIASPRPDASVATRSSLWAAALNAKTSAVTPSNESFNRSDKRHIGTFVWSE